MATEITPEWGAKMGKAEVGYDVGAGAPDHPLRTDKPAPVEQVDRDAAEDWRNALYDTLNNVDEAVAELAQDFARHRQPLAARVAELEAAVYAVVEATRAYLSHDGIGAQECLNRILGATDNPTINPIIAEIDASEEQKP